MKKIPIFIIFFIFAALTITFFTTWNSGRSNTDTHQFINQWMRNENGTLATNIHQSTAQDSDEVQGREALSESLGLLMLYAIETEDKPTFDQSYHTLVNLFMEESGFVYWKLTKNGKVEDPTNALVDDLRIVKALTEGYLLWQESKYKDTANQISHFLGKNMMNKSTLTDFYDRSNEARSDTITLSYLDIEALKILVQNNHITNDSYMRMIELSTGFPLKNGLAPKSYRIDRNEYLYDDEVNMIDQLLVALNKSQLSENSKGLIEFIYSELNNKGILYGEYNIETLKPSVDYESPAVYGLLIMLSIEIENKKLALKAYERMIEFRSPGTKYRGAYSISPEGNTHIFDNLVPLLSIEKLKNKGWIS
ncbi:glycosyl hydrolase family 8 [Halobacillus litoralis]|uniref:Glycosyl hydrolase n=1 Tax=Halobacillus litoralis TaxID=45668 RepID=A0A410MFV7_9BACI|nr:glycosyl hydrolase family 8 [Halobacillus litoralis]QAS53611.1 hypothetical protein HLI_16080 [Halobacillus litoralis]